MTVSSFPQTNWDTLAAFPIGETCCSFRKDANSKTLTQNTDIRDEHNNGKVLQMKKHAAESQKKSQTLQPATLQIQTQLEHLTVN